MLSLLLSSVYKQSYIFIYFQKNLLNVFKQYFSNCNRSWRVTTQFDSKNIFRLETAVINGAPTVFIDKELIYMLGLQHIILSMYKCHKFSYFFWRTIREDKSIFVAFLRRLYYSVTHNQWCPFSLLWGRYAYWDPITLVVQYLVCSEPHWTTTSCPVSLTRQLVFHRARQLKC